MIIWGGTIEEQLRTIQPPEALGSLNWIEEAKRSRNKEPALIAYGRTELEGKWSFNDSHLPFEQQRPPFYGTAFLLQRIYDSNPKRYFSENDIRLSSSCSIILARAKMFLVDLGLLGLNHI